jgi:ADP-ribosylation factor-like protein 2
MGTINTKVVVLGLDGSGKSAIVKYLKSKGEPIEAQPDPSTGYDLVDVKYKGVTLSLWDVAGKETLRGLWRHYFEKTDAVVWVVDSADTARREESINSLKRYALDEEALSDTILLVLANKQDMPGATAPVCFNLISHLIRKQQEIAEAFKDVIGEKRHWHVEGCSITDYKVTKLDTGYYLLITALQGVKNGFDWLSKMVKDKRKGKLQASGSGSSASLK